MKKIVILLSIGIVIAGLCSCGTNKEEENSAESTNYEEVNSEEVTENLETNSIGTTNQEETHIESTEITNQENDHSIESENQEATNTEGTHSQNENTETTSQENDYSIESENQEATNTGSTDSQDENTVATETSSTTVFREDVYSELIEDKEMYGTLEEIKEEFLDEEGNCYYYYIIEKFQWNDSVPSIVNENMSKFYKDYEVECIETEELYKPLEGESSTEFGMAIPFSNLHLLYLSHVGEDFVSIVYNQAEGMGGINPESMLEGITIDCNTGEEIEASGLLGKTEEELLAEISKEMGTDVLLTWEDVDFYVTDSYVVFFYRIPNLWEDVVYSRDGELLEIAG